jgi:hypothetical protein
LLETPAAGALDLDGGETGTGVAEDDEDHYGEEGSQFSFCGREGEGKRASDGNTEDESGEEDDEEGGESRRAKEGVEGEVVGVGYAVCLKNDGFDVRDEEGTVRSEAGIVSVSEEEGSGVAALGRCKWEDEVSGKKRRRTAKPALRPTKPTDSTIAPARGRSTMSVRSPLDTLGTAAVREGPGLR